MSEQTRPDGSRRADARRNRERILEAARVVFTGPVGGGPNGVALAPEQSMAEVARQAGVGRGTLYRNFPGRRELLEALLADEVEALIAAVEPSADEPGAALFRWLHRFAAFEDSKHPIATELLEYVGESNPMFNSSRRRVLAAGEPLLVAAQRAGEIRADVTLTQALDLVLAVGGLDREPGELAKILQIALDGLRTATPA